MEEAESYRKEKMQMLKSSATEISSSGGPIFPNSLDALSFNSSASERAAYPQFPPNLSQELSRRPGIPPVHPFSSSASPYSPIPASVAVTSPSPASAALSRPPAGGPNFSPLPSHSRSLSQPSLFSLDSLPSFTSFPIPDPADALSQPDLPASSNVTMEYSRTPLAPIQHAKTNPRRNVADEITPRKTHRRSQSDIPFTAFQSPVPMPGLPPLPQHFTGFHEQPTLVVRGSSSLGSAKLQAQFVKKEAEWNKEGDSDRKSEEDTGDDLISAYMNLESVDTVNSSGTEEKRDDLDRSENEAESSIDGSVNERFERNEKNKRNTGDDFGEVNNAPHHVRSVSMDSFMGILNFADELPKLPLSPGARHGHHLRSESMDGTTSTFSLEFGNGEFTGAELNKIMSNEKLAEIAMADPKRVKRILANRQSAARSKERKMRYISELEHRVQTLQTEATTLSAQLTLLQRDSAGLASQNNQLKFQLQAMEQQAKLRDALNEALSTELKRLKLSSGEAMSASLMFQLQQQQQCEHVSLDQLQSVEEQQNVDAVDDEMMQ